MDFFARSDADGIAVDVEQAHALEQLAAGAGNAALKILAGHSIVDHDSKVVLNSRVLRELASSSPDCGAPLIGLSRSSSKATTTSSMPIASRASG